MVRATQSGVSNIISPPTKGDSSSGNLFWGSSKSPSTSSGNKKQTSYRSSHIDASAYVTRLTIATGAQPARSLQLADLASVLVFLPKTVSRVQAMFPAQPSTLQQPLECSISCLSVVETPLVQYDLYPWNQGNRLSRGLMTRQVSMGNPRHAMRWVFWNDIYHF